MNKNLDLIHTKVHAIRMTQNYKPSQFELDIAKIISEEYKNQCDECREKALQYKYNPPIAKKNFLGGLFK